MTDNIVAIKKPFAADDVVKGLRKIADEIEAGEYGFPVTTCIVLIGNTYQTNRTAEGVSEMADSEYFALGPRTDLFTCRGLIATGLARL